MKKIFTRIIIICLTVFGYCANAQSILKDADEQFNLFNYVKAADLYTKAYRQKETLYTAERLATCYRLMHDYKKTESWYATTIGFPGSKSINTLYYAQALQSNSKYSEAKDQYLNYATLNKEVSNAQLAIWVSSCDSSMRWMRHPVALTIKSEAGLNSGQADWGAVKYGTGVVFTSDRINKEAEKQITAQKPLLKFDGDKVPDKKTYGWTGNDYLRLYQATATGDSLKLFPIDAPTDYHVGAACFSKDGSEMYFTLTRLPEKYDGPKSVIKTINIEIFTSKKDRYTGKWSKPVPFKYNNADKYSVGDPFLSPDGNTLYFVSDMPGTKGGTDIFYCNRTMKDEWAEPINFKALNSVGNERTPVVDSANNVYFSSDGGVGMGGLDIYKADRVGTEIRGIHNLAYPVNSPQDDFAFNFSTPVSGYFSSNRTSGASDDIYSFADNLMAIKNNDPTVKAKLPANGKKFALEGTAYDRTTSEPLNNTVVTLTKVKGGELKVQTDASGAFKFDLEEESNYRLVGEKTSYRSDNQTVSTVGLTTSQVITKDLHLEKITINKAIKLENIYYDFNKWFIRKDAAIELNKLIKIMNENPTIWIEIGSHTDSRGNDESNMLLSQRRAEAAVNYIVNKGGIDRNRITAQGYGESRLLNRCANGVNCSPAEHQLNRRTEFTIVKQ